MAKDLFTWITGEVNKRGWTNSELARRAGISPSTLSLVLSGDRKPGISFCVGVARAFDELPEKVLRLAGLIPPLPAPEDEGVNYEQLWDVVKNMSAQERQNVFEYARWRLQQEREQKRQQAGVERLGTAERTT
jgi:transcriptional regulator with XRE-family HTH domain